MADNAASLREHAAPAALLYSPQHMDRVIQREAAITDYRASNPSANNSPSTALLVASRTKKQRFGYGRVGDQILNDVPQTTVGFEHHLLLEPAPTEQETWHLLKRRALDHLLSIALLHITQQKEERDTLGSRRALLQSKLGILSRGGSFAHCTGKDDQASLQSRLQNIEQHLSRLGGAEDVMAGNLATVAEVLTQAERHLWLEDKLLCLDQLYALHDTPESSAPAIVFKGLKNNEGRQNYHPLCRDSCKRFGERNKKPGWLTYRYHTLGRGCLIPLSSQQPSYHQHTQRHIDLKP
ncbi:MAG: hypothetical protein R3E64_12165 [Halioglobus sp.]